MLDYYSLLIATCDDQSSPRCRKEDIVKIEEGESKREAYKLLKDAGWIIEGKVICKCPECSRQLRKVK